LYQVLTHQPHSLGQCAEQKVDMMYGFGSLVATTSEISVWIFLTHSFDLKKNERSVAILSYAHWYRLKKNTIENKNLILRMDMMATIDIR